jgi:hypothetical protein
MLKYSSVTPCRDVDYRQIEGEIMLPVDGGFIYQLGYQIHPLEEIREGDKFLDWYFPILTAWGAVDSLMTKSIFPIRTTKPAASDLSQILDRIARETPEPETITATHVHLIKTALSTFEHVLAAELGQIDLYLVRQKGGYETRSLIYHGELLFDPSLGRKVPEAIPDIREGARCLAFILPTAAAFHFHRANELVLHKYYDKVTNNKARPKNGSMGKYLEKLQKVGDPKVISALKDLKDLHRNPVIHPEQTLESNTEAIALVGLIQASVTYMLAAIPEPPKV